MDLASLLICIIYQSLKSLVHNLDPRREKAALTSLSYYSGSISMLFSSTTEWETPKKIGNSQAAFTTSW